MLFSHCHSISNFDRLCPPTGRVIPNGWMRRVHPPPAACLRRVGLCQAEVVLEWAVLCHCCEVQGMTVSMRMATGKVHAQIYKQQADVGTGRVLPRPIKQRAHDRACDIQLLRDLWRLVVCQYACLIVCWYVGAGNWSSKRDDAPYSTE